MINAFNTINIWVTGGYDGSNLFVIQIMRAIVCEEPAICKKMNIKHNTFLYYNPNNPNT
jgi:hypothetical protein